MRASLTATAMILTTFTSSWAQAPAPTSLEERVRSVLMTPGYENASWGILVVDSETGETIYERRADELFRPASVTKLYSCAMGLVELGADHRFRTPVVRRGEVRDGVLRGDLILIARGDPSMGGRTGPEGTLLFEDNDHTYAGSSGSSNAVLVASNPLAGLDHLARAVHDEGIRSIEGEVIIDDRLFDAAPSSGSGPRRVSPIVINDNVIDVVIAPGAKVGDRGVVTMVPATAFARMDALVETVEEGSRPELTVTVVGPRAFRVRGTIPVGHKPFVRIFEIEEPASFARALFIERLRERGVEVDATPLGSNPEDSLPPRDDVAGLPRVAEYVSPPFSESLRVILKVSHNLHASMLPLLVAAKHGERSLSDGLKREAAVLESLGVAAASISFGGGAGGSVSDLTTPRATVALLRGLAKRPDYPVFEAALPVLGRDGTLARAVSPESPARGHVRAKTGTYWVDNPLTGRSVITSKALAGTIDTAAGRKLTFAFFLNGVPIPARYQRVSDATLDAGRVLGRLAEVFYEWPSTAAASAPK
ncbi:MAG: D-alanyl-D-alanine carboxypeptidase/D-alanyl-D-alanine-endopeptidase [Isosphaeraceae bacterium]|nr:D-alanyl-D-alanine carboxypeptidase/D-alanyl-D-alanine-endopeptidase [Isosphaeraceae bacterium]